MKCRAEFFGEANSSLCGVREAELLPVSRAAFSSVGVLNEATVDLMALWL